MKNMTDIIEKDAIAIMENVEHKAVIDKLFAGILNIYLLSLDDLSPVHPLNVYPSATVASIIASSP